MGGKNRDNWIAARAVCPFFRHISGASIGCEGAYDGTFIQLGFRDKIAARRHLNDYCAQMEGCQECRVYQMLMEKYDG